MMSVALLATLQPVPSSEAVVEWLCIARVLSVLNSTHDSGPEFYKLLHKIGRDPRTPIPLKNQFADHELAILEKYGRVSKFRRDLSILGRSWRAYAERYNRAYERTFRLRESIQKMMSRKVLSKGEKAELKRLFSKSDMSVLRVMSRVYGPRIERIRKAGAASILVFPSAMVMAFLASASFDDSVPQADNEEAEILKPGEFEYIFYRGHAGLRTQEAVYDYYPGRAMRKLDFSEWKNERVRHSGNEPSLRVRFQVGEDAQKLQKFLDEEAGLLISSWVMPPIYTCISHANRAVESATSLCIPKGIDRSIVLTKAYFRMLKATGDPRVVSFRKYNGFGPFTSAGDSMLFEGIFGFLFFSEILMGSEFDRLPPESFRGPLWPK